MSQMRVRGRLNPSSNSPSPLRFLALTPRLYEAHCFGLLVLGLAATGLLALGLGATASFTSGSTPFLRRIAFIGASSAAAFFFRRMAMAFIAFMPFRMAIAFIAFRIPFAMAFGGGLRLA